MRRTPWSDGPAPPGTNHAGEHVPPWALGVDTGTPNPARVHDHFLGGEHNFGADRALAGRLEQAMPDVGEIIRANRAFLRRAVVHLTRVGIRQFLDLGSGIPTAGNVHEIAQRAAPEARVAYVDIDPVAVAHSRAVLGTNRRAGIVHRDLRDADDVLAAVRDSGLLDLDRPVAVLLVGVLHQVHSDDLPGVIARYRKALVPGSYLVVSHASADHRGGAAGDARHTGEGGGAGDPRYTGDGGAGGPRRDERGYGPDTDTLRGEAEVRALFAGFELIEPGLVQLPQWRPDDPGDVGPDPLRFSTFAGVGRRA